MATTNKGGSSFELTATHIRASENYPEYHLVRMEGTGALAIGLCSPAQGDPDGFGDGHIEVDGEVRELFIVQDDGFDLDADLEFHADNLAEEGRVLLAEAMAEFS